MSHELRTPLNAIIGYSEMLQEDAAESGTGSLAADLQKINTAGRHLLELINAVLDLSKIEAGKMDLYLETFSVPALVHDIATIVRPLAEKNGNRLGIHCGDDAGTMRADITKVRQTLFNLLSNACKFTDHGTVSLAVRRERGPAEGVVLVVDDDEGNREFLARHLRREGHTILAVAGGNDALELLAARPIDLVLLDVMMPGMTGYDVLRRLKSDPRLHDIPVLMISSLDEVESVACGIELGAEDYLSKPFDRVVLRARVNACLEKKRLRDQESRHLQELAEWNHLLEQRVQEQVSQVERLGRLKRFFSPQLAELIVAGGAEDPLRTHRREVTVVFLDLRGFTTFAETAEPEEVMAVLREYHAEVGRLILEHEGTLERFTGDGMMVFFNDPVEVANPAERAVRMAVAIQERVAQCTRGWRKRGYDLALGVGIAKGYATIGAIGFEGRWDYGAIGTVTNLAARLCGEAKGGQILVTSKVAAAVEGLVDVEEVAALTLKGLSRPVPTFNMRGLR